MSNAHSNHHFVPVFLLKQWHTAPDSRLTAFRYKGSRFLRSRCAAKSVCSLPHIYSTTGPDGSLDPSIERDFFGRAVDDPAAVAHSVLVKGTSTDWNAGRRRDWDRFLVSLWCRNPDKLQSMRALVKKWIAEEPDLVPGSAEVIDGAASEDAAMRWLQNCPAHLQDEAPVKLLPSVVDDSRLLEMFSTHTWVVRDFDKSTPDLLIADRPIVFEPTGGGGYFIALPIAPRSVYLAFSDRHLEPYYLDQMPDEELVAKLNLAAIAGAQAFVYGSGCHHEELVKHHLLQSS